MSSPNSSHHTSKDSDPPIHFLVWLSLAAVAAIKIWLVRCQSLTAECGAKYDDRLFINVADALTKGNWLGPYTNLTLAKGPFYPIWIATMSKVGVPLLLSQHLLYIAACLIFVIAARPLLRTPLTIFLVFAVLLLNPMSYSWPAMIHVLREGIYPSLTLLVVSCAIGLLVRAAGPATTLALWSAGLGLALSALLLTREEGIWMAPSLLIVVGAAAFRMWRNLAAWKVLSIAALTVAIAAVIIGSVAAMNRTMYGLFAVNELKSADFLAAYGALSRVRHDSRNPVVPVPREVRSRIYEVSPAFSELRPLLEGDVGKRWLDGFKYLQDRYSEDPEFAKKVRLVLDVDPTGIWSGVFFGDNIDLMGGWFIWAFRDAVASAGYHASATTAAAYYRRLANEVNAACLEGRLSCLPKRSSLMPPLRNEDIPLIVKTFTRGIISLVRFEGFDAFSDPSTGDEKSLEVFRDITHERLSPPESGVQGWAFSPRGTLEMSVVTTNGARVGTTVHFLPSTDVYEHFLSKGTDAPNALNARFDLHLAPSSGACCLSLSVDGKGVRNIPLDGSVTYINSEDLHFRFETLGFQAGPKRDDMKLSLLKRIGDIYQAFMPMLAVLSLLGYSAAGISACRRSRGRVVPIIATSLIVAVFARLALLSVIQVTSFPAILPHYLAPLHPLLMLFVALVLTDSYLKFGEKVSREEGTR